jgi:hypothetical protein
MLASRASDPALDGLLKDAGRVMTAFSAAYLHASGGLTLPRLKELLKGFGVASPGRARALLIYLHYLGYVEPIPALRRGQAAVYAANARFLKTYRKHQRAVLDAVTVLEPAAGLVFDRFDAPGVFESFVAHQGDAFLDGTRQGHAPAVQRIYYQVFLHRHAGIQIVQGLLTDAADDDVFPPAGPIPFSTNEAARRCKVSRVHVRRMLQDAVAGGLIEADAGAVRFTPQGREAVDWSYASQMIVFLTAAARALATCSELVSDLAEERVA